MTKKVKTLKGIVVSDKMAKTIVVAISGLKVHRKYQKKYVSTKKFKVHDPENKYKVGDTVEFSECRPISKDKMYKVL